MKVIDPDTGRSLPVNTPGELCIRSECVMLGIVPLTEASFISPPCLDLVTQFYT